MCGIFGYVGKNTDAGNLCFNALKHLEYRGYDSWGIAVSGKELDIKKELGKLPKVGPNFKFGKMVLGHSRWATHGGVTITNTHPHAGNNKQAIVVHNGIVENHLELKQLLLEKGIGLKSETDTEVIVQLYEHARVNQDPLTAFLKTIKLLEGNNAVVIMDLDAGILLVTKNGSPMIIGQNLEGNFIASDVAPLLEHCESVYFVENDEVLVVDNKNASIYDKLSSSFRSPKWEKPKIKLSEVELGSHKHYLIKEVSEQPEILRQIALNESEELKRMRDFILGSSDVWFTGCGSAYFAGMLATYFAANVGRSARSAYAHELPMLLGQMSEKSLVIAISQSGETIDVIDAVDAINKKHVKAGALINVPTSSLTRMVEQTLPIQAGPEICVLSTKAYTAMIANLYAIYNPGNSFKTSLLVAANAIEEMLEENVTSQIELIAKKICEKQSLFIIGTGQYYPLALEAALKIKEVSYIHAEAFPSGELKHGVIALIEEGTPCIVFAAKGEMGDRIKIHASEIRARGGKIISISPEKLDPRDEVIKVEFEDISFYFAALTAVQLLAYNCALTRNLDPDKPRNLAKSVTVR